MLNRCVTGVTIAMACVALPAMAQEQVDRYQLQRTDDGYVRLDTKTGSMSICQENSGQLICRMASDERAAYEGDLDALEDRVDALEARLKTLEAGRPAASMPDEQEFEQTLGYMERFFRRFMGIVRDFEQDNQPTQPQPDRT